MALNVGARASLGADIKLQLGDGSSDRSKTLFEYSLGPLKLFEIKFPILSGCVAIGRSTATMPSGVVTDVGSTVGDVWVGRQTPATIGPFFEPRTMREITLQYFDMQVVVQLVTANRGSVDFPDIYYVEYTGAFNLTSPYCQPKGFFFLHFIFSIFIFIYFFGQ